MTMRQNQAETRRQNVAKRSMTKEAKKLAGLIAGLRKSLDGIHKERTSAKLTGAEMGMLDERRNNLLLTIAALDDRLSAVQGLIDLGRPHIIRVH
jgi:predicted  nucleic acid-binding Zn-ribbon protein